MDNTNQNIDDLKNEIDELKKQVSSKNEEKDELGTGMSIVSFCFPIVGGIVWLANMKSSPNKASTACWCAVAGIIIGVIGNIAMEL
jgi:hypothetical protein